MLMEIVRSLEHLWKQKSILTSLRQSPKEYRISSRGGGSLKDGSYRQWTPSLLQVPLGVWVPALFT